jgi:hypothetical protein
LQKDKKDWEGKTKQIETSEHQSQKKLLDDNRELKKIIKE